MPPTLESDATRAYAVLAPAYDLLTAEYAYGPWLTAIERVAREHGLRGHRLLDVGCGTGKSFLPLLERGFEVTACDISPEMVEMDRQKGGGRARVHVADMRDLPVFC
jgi:ubiquinone/menaquinone biosynthesis C-methylase UbiE